MPLPRWHLAQVCTLPCLSARRLLLEQECPILHSLAELCFLSPFLHFAFVSAYDHLVALRSGGCCPKSPATASSHGAFVSRPYMVLVLLLGHKQPSLPFVFRSCHQAIFCVGTRRKAPKSWPEISLSSL